MTTEQLNFLSGKASEVAPRLLGCVIERKIDDLILRAKIVETEAYDQTDTASHSFNGKTQRTSVMFGPAGHLYVYFTYGMHYCCNIVTGQEGEGSAVLIRAVEPLQGEEHMEKLRGQPSYNLSNGPAKLCQALGIDRRLNGHNLLNEPLKLIVRPALDTSTTTTSTRIGINTAKDALWRYYVSDSPYVSKRS